MQSPQEEYVDLIQRVKQNAIARLIKIADLHNNMKLSRLATIMEKDLARNAKYQQALAA